MTEYLNGLIWAAAHLLAEASHVSGDLGSPDERARLDQLTLEAIQNTQTIRANLGLGKPL